MRRRSRGRLPRTVLVKASGVRMIAGKVTNEVGTGATVIAAASGAATAIERARTLRSRVSGGIAIGIGAVMAASGRIEHSVRSAHTVLSAPSAVSGETESPGRIEVSGRHEAKRPNGETERGGRRDLGLRSERDGLNELPARSVAGSPAEAGARGIPKVLPALNAAKVSAATSAQSPVKVSGDTAATPVRAGREAARQEAVARQTLGGAGPAARRIDRLGRAGLAAGWTVSRRPTWSGPSGAAARV